MKGSLPKGWLRPVLGVVLVSLTSFGIAYPLWWNHRASTAGAALLAQSTRSRVTPVSACSNKAIMDLAPQGSSPGVLEIPALGLVAPVLQGTSDSVLNVAVGHPPSTPWPGAAGESMVLAHDVSYFTNLSQVQPGERVIWRTSCLEATFRVDKKTILSPGDLVYPPTSGSGLALVTCYPTNALFWTTQRFVVTTHLVSVVLMKQALPIRANLNVPAMTVNAPGALVAQGLGLDKNSLQLGTLRLSGSPSSGIAQSPVPLLIEREALEVFFAAKKTIEQNKAGWWNDLVVAGLPMPANWPSFSRVNISIELAGSTPTSVSLVSPQASATVVLQGSTWRLAALGGA